MKTRRGRTKGILIDIVILAAAIIMAAGGMVAYGADESRVKARGESTAIDVAIYSAERAVEDEMEKMRRAKATVKLLNAYIADLKATRGDALLDAMDGKPTRRRTRIGNGRTTVTIQLVPTPTPTPVPTPTPEPIAFRNALPPWFTDSDLDIEICTGMSFSCGCTWCRIHKMAAAMEGSR